MAATDAQRGPGPDRRRAAGELICDRLRIIAGTTVVGFVVGFVVGGLGGRLAMRVITITSDPRLKGVLTDDEAPVNKFTFGGTLGLALFLGLGGIVVSLVYLAFRPAMPADIRWRAAIWAVLFWGIQGSGVFDPEGFDFTFLEPHWLGVAMFTAIFLAVGALSAIGVERVVDRWPWSLPGALPLLPLAATIVGPILAVGATVAAELPRRFTVFRVVVAVLMGLAVGIWVGPTTANVIRILT